MSICAEAYQQAIVFCCGMSLTSGTTNIAAIV
jgi:hypothetical protein